MEKVGYKLVEIQSGNIVESWGGVWGVHPAVPNPVFLPDGTTVYGMAVGDELHGFRLDVWEMGPPPPTQGDIVKERDRRLGLGFDHDFGAAGILRVGTTEQDMVGWSEVTSWASAQIALGHTDTTVTIVCDNGAVVVTAMDWMKVLDAATAFRQPIWGASFILAGMNPIPVDFADDKWWSGK